MSDPRERASHIATWRAGVLVFGTSAAVLVLEILAGRLLAPYVGVSLETFTGIVGTCLAGIAAGAALGGLLADRTDPRPLIGPALLVGGLLSWLSLPVISVLGPRLGDGPVAVVLLTATSMGGPVVVLSAVAPMVAKARLDRLEETGSVVGGLSAAGTLGALAGTFLTGFVAVTFLPGRVIVIVSGAVLVITGIVAMWRTGRRVGVGEVLGIAAVAGLVAFTGSPCQYETRYFCVRIERDAEQPSRRDLYLDRLRHASVDLEDPTALDIRYVRLFADVADSMAEGPLEVLHVGGGGFTFPAYLRERRPGSDNHVLELDGELVTIAEDHLGLRTGDGLSVRVGDARTALGDLASRSRDLVVGDAFAGESAPWHLATLEVAEEVDRILRPGGIYVMNLIDGGSNRLVRAELATLAEVFDHVAVIVPPGGVPEDHAVNQVLVASDEPLPTFQVDPADGEVVAGSALERFVGEAAVLTDDHAPVDQLVLS